MRSIDFVVEDLGPIENSLGLAVRIVSPQQEPVSKSVILTLVRFHVKYPATIVSMDHLGTARIEGHRYDNLLPVDCYGQVGMRMIG